MLLEFLAHLLELDFIWIVGLVLGNLHWVFALVAFVMLSGGEKRVVWRFLVIMGLLYAFLDILALGEWIIVPILVMVPIQLGLGLYFNEGSWVRKNELKIVAALYFVFSFVNTFIFVFPSG